MFVTLTDFNGDRVLFNANKILLICEKRKRGIVFSVVFTEDGNSFDVKEPFDVVANALAHKG